MRSMLSASAGTPSTHPVAAVDVERLRYDVVAVAGRQEHRGAGDVLRVSHPPRRHRLADEPFLLADLAMFVLGKEAIDHVPHRRVDHPGRDAVDIDLVFDEPKPGRLREADNRRLGRAIDRNERLTTAAGLAGHVDDLAAAALLDHLPRR